MECPCEVEERNIDYEKSDKLNEPYQSEKLGKLNSICTDIIEKT